LGHIPDLSNFDTRNPDHKKIAKAGLLVYHKPMISCGLDGWLDGEDINTAITYYRRLEKMRLTYLYAHQAPRKRDINHYVTLLQKHRFAGIVFNTSRTSRGGTHWVSVKRVRNRITYFDPKGDPPSTTMRTILQDTKFEASYNNHRYQHGTTECGIYAVAFLLGHTLGDDDTMRSRRTLYYATPPTPSEEDIKAAKAIARSAGVRWSSLNEGAKSAYIRLV